MAAPTGPWACPSARSSTCCATTPMAILLESYRKVIYGDLGATSRPTAARARSGRRPRMPDLAVLAVIFATGVVILVIGTIVFKRLEPAFAKVL